MKRIFLILLLVPFLAFSATNRFNKIIFFGDSLSDTGNLYRYLGHWLPKSPPYYKGRFSNGPVWSELVYQHYFADRHDMADYNYAVGGAAAVLSVNAPLPFTLATEVDDYIYLHAKKDKEKNLYVVWIGGNNYLKAPPNPEKITSKVVDAISYSIKNLISHGARQFLVANLPDMGSVPEGAENGKSEYLRQLSDLHNKKLSAEVDSLKRAYPAVRFVYFDAAKIFQEFMQDPGKFNIHHTKTACFTGGYTMKYDKQQLTEYMTRSLKEHGYAFTSKYKQSFLDDPVLAESIRMAQYADNKNLSTPDCSDYLFWDHIHPTTVMHRQVAKFIEASLDSAGFVAVK